jgi:hypothetical protein
MSPSRSSLRSARRGWRARISPQFTSPPEVDDHSFPCLSPATDNPRRVMRCDAVSRETLASALGFGRLSGPTTCRRPLRSCRDSHLGTRDGGCVASAIGPTGAWPRAEASTSSWPSAGLRVVSAGPATAPGGVGKQMGSLARLPASLQSRGRTRRISGSVGAGRNRARGGRLRGRTRSHWYRPGVPRRTRWGAQPRRSRLRAPALLTARRRDSMATPLRLAFPLARAAPQYGYLEAWCPTAQGKNHIKTRRRFT